MFLFTLFFLLGDLWLQFFSELPKFSFLFFILSTSLILSCLLKPYIKFIFILPAFLCGFTYTALYASHTSSWVLAKELEDKPIQIQGYIASIPQKNAWQSSFLLQLKSQPALLRLNWSQAPKNLKVGDEWRLQVKLKRIHSTQNPGGFDFEAWALQKGLRASGHVLNKTHQQFISHTWRYTLDQFRQYLQSLIQANLPHSATAPWLLALVMGEHVGIDAQDWQVLRNTGTNHLMAIAGLHIGMIAGLTSLIVNWCWRRSSRLLLFLPAQQASAIACLMLAILYSALAGFSIPTQRACLMLCIFIFALLSKRRVMTWHVWSSALLIVLLCNPLSILTESFCLSFATIALIIFGMQARLAPRGWWWKWVRVQWVIGFGLIPLTILLFQQCSIISLIANSVAIPWLGFLILPFCFLAALFAPLSGAISHLLLLIADVSLKGLWSVLSILSTLPFSTWQHAANNYFALALSLLAILYLLAPRGLPGKGLALIWLLPLLFETTALLKTGEINMTLLDVGQGLSVLIETQSHYLVFDTGAKLGNNDAGEAIVWPYLIKRGIKRIDHLVISHGDNDHIGGMQALLDHLPVSKISTSMPEKIKNRKADYCFAGQSWDWDGVHFAFLYPKPSTLGLDNDSSCVLKIDNGKQSILLTGDIEKYAEKVLISEVQPLAADILVAPHHGSNTSAWLPFIQAVHPQWVLYASGYLNRYHLPHPHVQSVYASLGVKQLNTVDTGAIQIKLDPAQPIRFVLHRKESKKYYWDV